MDNCIFCKIINGEIKPIILDENEDVLVIMSLENHPLILTKKHYPDIFELDEKSAAAVMQMAVKIANAIKKSLQADGINLVQSNGKAANQDVFHFHLHIKPRWFDDDVKLQWNPKNLTEDQRIETASKIKSELN